MHPPQPLHTLKEENLEIVPLLDAPALTIQLSGACDAFAIVPLGAYLTDVFAELQRGGYPKVVFDIRGLCLLNSSCLKQFITFLHKLRSTHSGCTVDFHVDQSSTWQGRALAAFVRMCPDIVSVVKVSANDAPTHH
jgi:hypothetical protein